MRLGIDASNLRGGGGVTHLVELLAAAEPEGHGFSEVTVWGGLATLRQIEQRPWLKKIYQPALDQNLFYRTLWQNGRLSKLAETGKCDVLLVPGGSYLGRFRPVVIMCRNMLPFEWKELRRYGWSRMTLKFLILRAVQRRSFRRADALIFLTKYAQNVVVGEMELSSRETRIIPHGVNARFLNPHVEHAPLSRFSVDDPFRIIYVSIIDVYKHQWNVAEAVAQLRSAGLPITLDLIGPAYPRALSRLRATLERLDPTGDFIRYRGPVLHSELHMSYKNASMCVFASSCENMPNILLEAMESGLPVACSDRGPMREIAGEGAVYFNPENVTDIARAIRTLAIDSGLRATKAGLSSERAKAFTWVRCAHETLRFLAEVARAKPSLGGGR